MSFDQAARTYDQDFTQTVLAQWLRARVWSRLDRLFQPGMRVLEIGCGTGEDAVYLAKRGVEVIATDASLEMLHITQQKAIATDTNISIQQFNLNDQSTWQIDGAFDGVYSNFGVLNCTPNWRELGAWLAGKLAPDADVGLGVMGRFCLWETLWHGLHFDFATATRRWSGKSSATLADGNTFPVFYPSAQTLTAALLPHFQPTDFIGVGVFLPPSDSFGVIESRPLLQRRLINLESRLAHRSPWRNWADHYWLEMKKRN